MTPINPYEAPQQDPTVPRQAPGFHPRPCPECRGTDIQPSPYSAWRGRRAARAIEDVYCTGCNCNFNGETGIVYPPKGRVLPWFLLAVFAAVAYFGFLVFSVISAVAAL